jgi:hypothetical protein
MQKFATWKFHGFLPGMISCAAIASAHPARASLRFDARELDHFAPFLGLFSDQLPKIRW